MEQRDFKKHFKFHNFSEIFYCEFECFMQCQYTRTILRNKNMGQSLSLMKYLMKYDTVE